jgi:diguanylate cyclase (GGDEF)-like protein
MTMDSPSAVEIELIRELRQTLSRLEAALSQISDGLVITSRNGQILWCNSAFTRLINQPRLELLGQMIYDLLPRDAEGCPILNPSAVRASGAKGGASKAMLCRNPVQALAIEWRQVIREEERPVIFSFRDVSMRISIQELKLEAEQSERRRRQTESLNEQLLHEQQALAAKVVECPVTGLPNRRGLALRMNIALDELKSKPGQLTILFCDLNRFKETNDLHGHQVGDELLIEVARRLQNSLRRNDTLSRLGGDEFVVVTTNITNQNDAIQLAERLQEALGEPWSVDNQTIRPTMSIGITMTTDARISTEELLRRADLAMYDAKTKKNRYISIYEKSIDARVKQEIFQRRQLQEAIQEQTMHLLFQPIVNLKDGSTHAVEGLLRLRRDDPNAMPPTEFIPIAEQTGLILPLGQWVITAAMHEIHRRIQDSQETIISINVSPMQLKERGLSQWILQRADAMNIDPAWLALEVTETVLIEQPELTTGELRRLRQAGIKVYLDDFGTGYSSMSWLARLPIDAIKIDKSFTAGFLFSARKAKVIRSMISLAQELGLEVICEGIETEQQRQGLLTMGSTLGQGYLFGHPASAQGLPMTPRLPSGA